MQMHERIDKQNREFRLRLKHISSIGLSTEVLMKMRSNWNSHALLAEMYCGTNNKNCTNNKY